MYRPPPGLSRCHMNQSRSAKSNGGWFGTCLPATTTPWRLVTRTPSSSGRCCACASTSVVAASVSRRPALSWRSRSFTTAMSTVSMRWTSYETLYCRADARFWASSVARSSSCSCVVTKE